MMMTTNLCRADWNACMNPVRTNVGIRISIIAQFEKGGREISGV